MEISETERVALQNNVGELIGLKVQPEQAAAERAVVLAMDTVGILFRGSPEPESEEEQLAKAAGEARYRNSRIQIWGSENQWNVWLTDSQSEADNIRLEKQRMLVQGACDSGQRWTLENYADELAVQDYARAQAERRLLRLAGAGLLNQPREKRDVFRPKLKELGEIEDHAKRRTIVNTTDFDNRPEIKAIDKAIAEASLQT